MPGDPEQQELSVSDYLRIALVAIVAIVVAKKVLPMIPGAEPVAALL